MSEQEDAQIASLRQRNNDLAEEIKRLNGEIITLRNYLKATKALVDLSLAEYGQPLGKELSAPS